MSKSSRSQAQGRALVPVGNACANWALRKKSHPSVQEREEGKKRLQWARGWAEHLISADAEEKKNGSHSRAHSPAETGSRTKGEPASRWTSANPAGQAAMDTAVMPGERGRWAAARESRAHTRAPRPNPGARSAARAPGGGTSVTGAAGGLSGHVQRRACHPAEIALEAQTRFRSPDTH